MAELCVLQEPGMEEPCMLQGSKACPGNTKNQGVKNPSLLGVSPASSIDHCSY